MLARIAALGHVDVLVSAHFAGAIEDLTRYPMADGSTATTPDDILPTWAAAWRRTVAAVSPYVRNIVSVHDTPFAHLDVPSCLAIQTETASACEFDRAAGLRDADAVLTAELRTRRTETIDLDRFVCPGQTCPVLWQDGSIIYRDDRHLSGTVVAKLGAPVARALQHVMDTTAGRPGRKARPGAGPGP